MLKFLSKDGDNFIFREPKMSDAKSCMEFINELVREGAPITINKKVTLKEEQTWLKKQVAKIKGGKVFMIVAEKNGEIVAICEIIRRKYNMAHIADLGISVKKKYRRVGIAEAIFREVLKKADGKGIEIVRLCVYEYNAPAKALYKKLGFVREAVLKNEIKCAGKCKNAHVMSLYIKK